MILNHEFWLVEMLKDIPRKPIKKIHNKDELKQQGSVGKYIK